MKNRKIVYVLLILTVLFTLIGGTFAYLNFTFEATNSNYVSETHCFQIDYTINNENSGQDITGTLFPSANPTGGLNGRVGLKTNNNCELNGIGTLKLHINDSIDSTSFTKLTTKASSYCRSRKTGEAVNLSESECTEAGNRWIDIPTSYCENTNTLEYMKDYTTSSDCTSNGGTWVTNGSPLKYAVYNNVDLTTPVSVGHIISTDRGTDMTIFDNFMVISEQKYYHIYIWLDGNLTDNTFEELPFSGYILSSVTQNNRSVPTEYQQVEYIESTGTQYIDTGVYPDINTKIELEAMSTTTSTENKWYQITGTITSYHHQSGIQAAFNPQSSLISLDYGTAGAGNRTVPTNIRFNVIMANNANYIDGVQQTQSGTFSGTAEYSLWIFSLNYAGNPYYTYTGRIYSYKIYQNGELIRDFIPVKRNSDGEAGLYDVVNDVFYTNAGTGTFEIGPDV